MNEHIRRGMLALRLADRDEATKEFIEALMDPDPLIRRIATNRLYELHPERVFASTHSFAQLYHRETCNAKYVIVPSHIVRFSDWRAAEAAGRVPCAVCKPIRSTPHKWGSPPATEK